MGRKSSLTEKQWDEIGRRLVSGEKAATLASEYGINRAAISRRFSQQIATVKTVANQIVAAEDALRALPIPQQINAINLADQLRSISMNLASAANYGALTAHRLSGIAHGQVEKVDDAEPEKSTEALQRVAVLTKMANASAEIGINLLRANKEAVDELNKGEEDKVPAGLTHFYPD
jgi:hypothetical protein